MAKGPTDGGHTGDRKETSLPHARGVKSIRVRFEVNLDMISTKSGFRSYFLTEFFTGKEWISKERCSPRVRKRRTLTLVGV